MKTIYLPDELYTVLQKIKEVCRTMSKDVSHKNMTDEEIISILIGSFIDSIGQSIIIKENKKSFNNIGLN